MASSAPLQPADLKLWAQKWRWYERNSLPWNRARIHYELARRRAFARWPLHGNVLEMLREGRLEVGEHVLFEPGVWLTAAGAGPDPHRRRHVPQPRRAGRGAWTSCEIGEHCMLANGCFVTDANHRFDDPDQPVPWQGFTSKGPTRIGDNVWLGANVVVTSGVTIGERCVVGRELGGHSRPPAALDRRRRARPKRCGSGQVLRQHDVDAEHDAGGEHSERERGEQRVGGRRRARCPRGGPRPSAPIPSTTSEYVSVTPTPASSDTQTTSSSPAPSMAAISALRRQRPAGDGPAHAQPRRARRTGARRRPPGPWPRRRTG